MIKTSLHCGLLALCLVVLPALPVQAGYETGIISFCKAKVGLRVGGGECAHLATEALRYSGAEFSRTNMADYPVSGDYVWGTFVKEMGRNSSRKVYDTKPTNKCKIGDIIQYRLGTSSTGKSHHTAIVAAVNSSGYPTSIYQQNYNSQRFVSKDSTDLHQKLKDRGGYLRIYRAKAPVAYTGTKFSLVNNAKSSSVSFKINGSSRSIGARNTASGFSTWTSSSSAPKIEVGGRTYQLSNRKGYEFYLSGSTIKLRALSM